MKQDVGFKINSKKKRKCLSSIKWETSLCGLKKFFNKLEISHALMVENVALKKMQTKWIYIFQCDACENSPIKLIIKKMTFLAKK